MKRISFVSAVLGFCLLFGFSVYAEGPVASVPHTGQAAAKATLPDDQSKKPSGEAPVTQGRPAAVMPERVYTFETVPEGTEVRHDFVIENHGTAPLRIIKVETG